VMTACPRSMRKDKCVLQEWNGALPMQRALDTVPAANAYPVLDLLSRRACASHLDNAKLRAVVQEKVCMAHRMAAAMVPLARAWARPA
jgi:hypothetical protein